MTTYTIQVTNVPEDVPSDVLVEHVAVAVRKMQKGRKALKRINVRIVEKVPTRKHPFDGPEVNDDPGFVMPFTDSEWAKATGENVIFSGRREEEWEDTPLKGQVFASPEVEVIEFDVTDILPDLYNAIAEDFPHLAELFQAKREEREVKRSTSITDPVPEGEWDLDNGENVGDEL